MGVYMVSANVRRIVDFVSDTYLSHLLVTRPSKSRALECFVVEVAQKSTHIAMIVRTYTIQL
jgi:hypothetical protein